jgi:hypothetical protein
MDIAGKKVAIPKKGFSAKEVAVLFNVKPITVQKFAARYGVPYDGEGYRKNYHFFEQDIMSFINRPKPGRRWDKKHST